MKAKNDFILNVLHVVSWIIFIGLCIEAGALLLNFVFTLFKPIAYDNIYKGLNLSEMYQNQFNHYVVVMSFIIVLSILKAYLFYLVVKIFMKLNLVNPFHIEISNLIQKLSLEALSIAIVSVIAHEYAERFIHSEYEIKLVEKYWEDTATFLLMTAIIFVISQIFKKGIELQNENDLTI